MAAGSIAVRDLLTSPARPARVVAAFPSAVYLQVSGAAPGADVLALLARDAVRLPLGLVVGTDTVDAPFAGLSRGGEVIVGDGAARCAAGEWRVLRWWDPRVPVLRPAGPAMDRAPERWPVPGGWPVPELDPRGVDAAVRGLVGRGPGLTPAGDDLLCGALAALSAVGDQDRRRALADAVRRHSGRTTTVSAALLHCAAAGHGLPELSRLLAAVLRRASLDRQRAALDGLLRVGHTSGAALATGALLTLGPLLTPTSPVIMHVRATSAEGSGANVHDHGQVGGTTEEAA